MTDHTVELLLGDLAIIIVLARLLGGAAKRVGQPAVVGEIIAGILLGPTLWHGRIDSTLFPVTLTPPLTTLADLGLVLFMFIVGYEVDLNLLRGRAKVAASVSLCSVGVPLTFGAGLGVWLAHRHHAHNTVLFVFFLAIAMSVTAFPVLARILAERGLHRTKVGSLALAAAAIDDVLAWTVLAVLVAAAGSGGHQLRLVFAPVYGVVMLVLVPPLLRKLAAGYRVDGRLTPNLLATILVGLLLSCATTEWLGVKFMFGAFLFGAVMPRGELAGLREDILERLEQISVLVLLPVFFVVSGLSVNLSTIGVSGLFELLVIMVVAVAGKFGGAILGARLVGVRGRQAGVLAALMNTRGLTELVILSVGLQLKILDKRLYSLLVLMAVATTAMAGPLLKLIYPERYMRRDLEEADRTALGRQATHRILVLVDRPDAGGPLVDIGANLTASRSHSELVISHLVPYRRKKRLEVGGGLSGELTLITETMAELNGLAGRARQAGAATVVQCRLSEDVSDELPGYVAMAAPDTVVLGPDHGSGTVFGADATTQIVTVLRAPPERASAVAIHWAGGSDGAAALQVAAQLAVAHHVELVLIPSSGRYGSVIADLNARGLATLHGPPPPGALIVAAASGSDDAHLAVRAGWKEGSDDQERWTSTLNRNGAL